MSPFLPRIRHAISPPPPCPSQRPDTSARLPHCRSSSRPEASRGRRIRTIRSQWPAFQRTRHHVTDDDDVPRIWVDADACPGVIKDLLFRAAERTRVRVTLVANQWLRTPHSRFIDAIQVPGGFDVADRAYVLRGRPGALGVPQDIRRASGRENEAPEV